MAVLGGGYIAAEMSHVFGSLGTAVTIVERGQHLLSRHDADIRARFTEHYRERFDLRLNSAVQRVSAAGTGVSLDLATPSGTQRVDSEVLLVATGRKPNSDLLDVAAAGIEVDAHGHVCTDDTMQTSVPGIWALGDLANHSQLTGSTRRSAMSRPASRIADVHVQVVARFDVEAAYCEGAAAAEPPAQVTALRAGLPAPKGPFPGRLVPPWLSGGPSSRCDG
jgi:pyruvate/2-oxoglutarate dehydrogenase complex dihydrolipoamide dehydrogenase (E3) component